MFLQNFLNSITSGRHYRKRYCFHKTINFYGCTSITLLSYSHKAKKPWKCMLVACRQLHYRWTQQSTIKTTEAL